MCPPKPKIQEPPPIPDPAPPPEETATEIVRDTGDQEKPGRERTRRAASDLRIHLNVPGNTNGNGLNV